MSKTKTEPEFTGWRAKFWPIHNFEMKKFVPMGLIMFCLLFNYTALRDTKDTLIVNAAGSGLITFVKLYGVTPMAILFVVLYAKLCNIMSRENVFYTVVSGFVAFFVAFAFVIQPNIDSFHFSAETLTSLKTSYPYLEGWINMVGYWGYTLFYIMAELWGSAMIALLFWQFANEITRMREAKRFYGLFVVVGNVALIFSGQAVKFLSKELHHFFPEADNQWTLSLKFLMGTVAVFGVLTMYLYYWMNRHILTDPVYYDAAEKEKTPKKKKAKPGLMESAKIIFKSPELGLIALLIVSYGVTINLVEIQWKEQLKFYFEGDKNAYNAFMGDFSTITGIVTIFLALFVGSSVLRKTSWFTAAVITPLVIAVGGVFFFAFIFAKDSMAFILDSLKTNPVTAAVFLGMFIVIASKSIKYVLFDPTKEMAYIPLDEELRSKGKAAVDVIGGRAGKAGGAFVQSTLLAIYATTNVLVIVPHAFVTFLIIAALWLFAVKALSVKVGQAQEKTNKA